MTEKDKKNIKLKVAEALQDDAYKGTARMDIKIMQELGVRRGDVIGIKGNRETVAIVDRSYPADIGAGIIRIDGILRRNAKTGISENVVISKIEVKEAKKVQIAPAQGEIVIRGDKDAVEEELRNMLLGRAIVRGDLVMVGGVKTRRDLMSQGSIDSDEIFGDLFKELNSMGFMNGNFGGGGFSSLAKIKYIISKVSPEGAVIIGDNTKLELSNKPIEVSEDTGKILEVTYDDVGGLTEEVKKIREMVELPLKHPEIFDRLGIEPPKGVLLHGPPGTGKTLLAKAVANESESNFILVNGPEIHTAMYGGSEKNIREIFEKAEKNAPTIIFFDEIDAIAPSREEGGHSGEVERRVVSQLLTEMDGLKSRGKVVVIGATNRPNSIDLALRRPGRFDREIEINAPDKNGRLSILKIHTRNMPLDKSVNLDNLASITHGFVGADLSALAKEAAMVVLRKAMPNLNIQEEGEIPEEILKNLKVSNEDFEEALKFVRPSAMREVLVETPNVGWNDVGGLEKVKQELKEAIEWPLNSPESFKRLGIRPPKGLLLYGPPGTGKTLLAKAVAKESKANFIQVKGPSLLSMWVGESEKGVRKIFSKARQVSPCIIFFDEVDSLAGKRGMDMGNKVTEHVLNQILSEMDGIEENPGVVIIGATNRPDMLDPAILRPGRFDRILLVGPSDKKGRLEVLKIHTKNMPLAKDVNINELADKTECYVGSDIEALCREAAMLALRKDLRADKVKLENFEEALKKVKPSVTKYDLERYQKVEENYLKSAKSALEGNSYLG